MILSGRGLQPACQAVQLLCLDFVHHRCQGAEVVWAIATSPVAPRHPGRRAFCLQGPLGDAVQAHALHWSKSAGHAQGFLRIDEHDLQMLCLLCARDFAEAATGTGVDGQLGSLAPPAVVFRPPLIDIGRHRLPYARGFGCDQDAVFNGEACSCGVFDFSVCGQGEGCCEQQERSGSAGHGCCSC